MLPSWWGWVVVALIVLATLLTWLPVIDLPFGDPNEGADPGRARDPRSELLGEGSGGVRLGDRFLALPPCHQLRPPSAAHQPGACGGGGDAGAGRVAARLFGYLSGLATLVLVPALLRALRVDWGPHPPRHRCPGCDTFLLGLRPSRRWVRPGGRFRRRGGHAPPVARSSPLGGLEYRRAGGIHRDAVVGGRPVRRVALGLAGYGARLDQVTVPVATGGLLGAAVTAAWMLQATRFGELVNAARERSDTTDFTFGEFLAEQVVKARSLVPLWLLILVIPALVAGIWDRRTRVVTGITLASLPSGHSPLNRELRPTPTGTTTGCSR